jgi:hypothetical protein
MAGKNTHKVEVTAQLPWGATGRVESAAMTEAKAKEWAADAAASGLDPKIRKVK